MAEVVRPSFHCRRSPMWWVLLIVPIRQGIRKMQPNGCAEDDSLPGLHGPL